MYKMTDNLIKSFYRSIKNRISYANLKDIEFTNISHPHMITHHVSQPTTSGFTKAVEIIPASYTGYDNEFIIKTRGGGVKKISIVFKDSSSNDPEIERFAATPTFGYTGTGGYCKPLEVYLVKTSARLWSLYASTYHWGNVDCIGWVGGSVNANINFTNEAITSLPTGYLTPTEVSYIP